MRESDSPANHERLEAWKLAVDLVVESYAIARVLPTHERFALAMQIRRAATSVPANIAEGSARCSPRERMHSLSTARGELSELRTHLIVAERLGYVDRATIASTLRLSDSVFRLINGLRRYVEGRSRAVASP
jgi:four helix bundle protein